jgi:hypothetical protein
MSAEVARLATLIRPYVAADEMKFSSTAEFERMVIAEPEIGGQVVSQHRDISLVAFVTLRTESILRQLEGPPQDVPQGSPGAPARKATRR